MCPTHDQPLLGQGCIQVTFYKTRNYRTQNYLPRKPHRPDARHEESNCSRRGIILRSRYQTLDIVLYRLYIRIYHLAVYIRRCLC